MEEKTPFVPLKIGVDFGGVCSKSAERYESNGKKVELINVENCVEVLRELRALGHKLYLVSFCGRARADSTRTYLEPLNLFDGLYFVKDRKYKQSICAFLGLDLMIDDRLDVLETVSPTAAMLFTGAGGEYPNEITQYKKLKLRYIASDWKDVRALVANAKSLNLQPDNQVKVERICYL